MAHEPMSNREISQRLSTIERRQESMHGENRAGIAEIQRTMLTLADYQREANGRTGRLETDVAVLKQQQRTTAEEIEEIKEAAKGAAKEAVKEATPSQGRIATLSTLAAGGAFGGLMAAWKIIDAIWNAVQGVR